MMFHGLRQLRELRNNLFLEAGELRELQWNKFKFMLSHAYENVRFYHRKFDQANIKPDEIRTAEDLRKLPLTTKEELQKAHEECIADRNIDREKCEKTSTTGSTGIPLSLLLDKRAIDYGIGLWIRAYERNGLHMWDKMAVIRNPNYFPKKRWFQNLGIMRRKYISAFTDSEYQMRIIRQYSPRFIKGYPSALTELAHTWKTQAQSLPLRLIFSGSELLDSRARSLIKSSFDTDVVSYYGAMEFSLVAWECRAHSGFHINADSVLLECLEGEEQVGSGECGEVVCTGLNNYAMPLIRYRLDDVAVPTSEECSCGVKLPLLRSIEGRTHDFLVTLNGRRLPPTMFYPFPFDNYVGIRQFRTTQERRDRLVIQLIIDKGIFDMSRLDTARLRIKKLFGEDMQVDFVIVDKFEKDTTGKVRVVSRLF